MPFYILHQFVLLLIGYWVVQLEIYTFFKYIFISGLSFAVIMGLCDFTYQTVPTGPLSIRPERKISAQNAVRLNLFSFAEIRHVRVLPNC